VKRLPWRWHDYRTDLPKWLTSDIGKIIVAWSVFERELEELIRLLMDVDIMIGRVTSKRLNAKSRFQVAVNLVQGLVYYDRLKPGMLKELITFRRKIFEPLESKRDMLAHGLWDRDKGKWCVLWLAESRETPTLAPELMSLSRAVLPQIVRLTHADLREIERQIAEATKSLVGLCERFGSALAPLQHKPPKYTRRRRNR